MKKIFTIALCLLISSLKSQVIYSNSFGNLTLQNDIQIYGSNTITTTYTTAPSGFDLIDDGLKITLAVITLLTNLSMLLL
jgi:hypothetical protein